MQVLIQEFTNYHFDVKPNALHGALDRFAQFFIDPLCKADALEREVMAVDNEFSGIRSTLHCWHQWLPFCPFNRNLFHLSLTVVVPIDNCFSHLLTSLALVVALPQTSTSPDDADTNHLFVP